MKKAAHTVEEIKAMPLQKLVTVAHDEYGIEYKMQKKVELQDLVIVAMNVSGGKEEEAPVAPKKESLKKKEPVGKEAKSGKGKAEADKKEAVPAKKEVAKKSKGKTPAEDPELTEAQKAIMKDKTATKSEKVRKLYKSGMTIAQISREVKIHYSFAYCVVDAHKKLLAPKKDAKKETAGKGKGK